ncbi:MAG: serine/threonine protein kinase, partial [Kiritimatiellae bacterium]|nr:serine/threonine protein kinase [Kiritimatiellia bacterium]
VAVYDAGFDEEKGVYYLVMDYVNGGDLRQAIAFAGHFDPDRAVEVIMQVASALEAAQKFKVVHRDIKPENIMIQPDGLVKLVDLGIAKSDDIKDSLNTTLESVFGTPAYVAPEQAVDASTVDARADIYSLGIVLFEMIAGRTPYEGPNAPQILAKTLSPEPIPDIRDFAPGVKPMLAVLIRRMCVKERDRRIAGPTELLAEFARLGYRLDERSKASVQYSDSAESAPTIISVREVLDSLPSNRKSTLSFDTTDVEIQNFIAELKRKKLMKKIAAAVGVAALAMALAYLIAALRG